MKCRHVIYLLLQTLKVTSTPEEVTDICRDISISYSELVNSTRGALATVESEDVRCHRYTVAMVTCLS